MVLFDENLHILTTNPAAARLLGLSTSEAIGKPVFANMGDLGSETLGKLSELLRGERTELDVEIKWGSGKGEQTSRILLQRVVHSEQLPMFAMHITDLTDLRLSEAESLRALRLNELVASISASFLDSRWENADADIERAMGRLGRLLELNRLQLRQTSTATRVSDLAIEWTAPGQKPTAEENRQLVIDTDGPRAMAFTATTTVNATFAELDLATLAAATEPSDSVVIVPVVAGERQVGALVAIASRNEWSDHELAVLHGFVNLVTQLRTRATVEAASRQRLSVEDLVRRVATDLINISPGDSAARTVAALADLGAFFDVQRVMRWRFEPGADHIAVSEAWSGDSVSGLGNSIRKVPVVSGSGLEEVLTLTDPVGHVFETHELVPSVEAGTPGHSLPDASFLLVPLVTAGTTAGALVFERRRGVAWHELEIRALETVAALVGQLDARIEAERYLSSSFSQSPVGILLTDDNNMIVASNPSFAQFLGIEANRLIGGGLDHFVDGSASWLDGLAADGHQGEIAFSRTDHRTVWGRVNSVRIPAPEGHTEHVLSYVEDMTRARRNRERLEFQANHDELTGLANRRVFIDELTACIGSPRAADDAAVLMLDLDRFKVVNDSLGHSIGDEILRTVSDRLRLAVRGVDLISRLGGDEFVVLLRGPVGELEAVSVAQRIIELIREPIQTGSHEVFITGSIGIAFPNEQDRQIEDVLRHADAAMYEAKNKGRQRFEIFDERSREIVADRIDTEAQLRRAIEKDELEVHYQPEYELDTQTIVGVESLVRWNHPTKGLLTAGVFISVAEDTGLVVEIGRLVLEEACRQGADWNSRRRDPLVMRVNLSARQLERASIVDEVREALAASGLPAELLCLEITETALMADVEESLRLLTELRALGVHLAIDDFGTGFSSLAYLKRFPVDILKIDQAFIRHVDTDPTDEAIVLSIIRLADALGLDVVAEGIEEVEHRDKLVEMGCNRGQGFGLARPAAAETIAELLDLKALAK